MKTLMRIALAGALLLGPVAVAHADTIYLKTGAVIVGDVTLVGEEDVVVNAYFPEEGKHTFKRSDLAPRSLYDLLERRSDPKDPAARLELARFAEANGLFGSAVADYSAVAKLVPAQRREMEKRIRGVREAIAQRVLADARDLLDGGNARGALMYLHTVRELYGGTKAAGEADKLMRTTHERAGAAADVAAKTVSVNKAESVVKALRKDLEKGDREARKIGGHEGDSSLDRRAAERAVKFYESAWKKTKSLPVAGGGEALQEVIRGLRKTVKDKLAKAYLTAGTIHIQRRSIPRAEEYCNKACELQPEDKANHALHRLIIQAKIYDGYGYGWTSGVQVR